MNFSSPQLVADLPRGQAGGGGREWQAVRFGRRSNAGQRRSLKTLSITRKLKYNSNKTKLRYGSIEKI